ncbi:AIR synthase-related protein, partial [bacterium]|nr:AIR synthase-related protein [bacterium]
GIHGATFSSLSLDKDTEVSAVQIGNPIMEKKVTDTILKARDEGLYRAITDCGAGGFSSAAGELGAECGVKVNLEKAPLKYEGLRPWEIWVSEAQERMVLAVPPENLNRILEIFEKEDVEATVIGEFTNDKKLTLFYNDETVGELDMEFLHHGLPKIKRKALWRRKRFEEPRVGFGKSIAKDLKKILQDPNVSSKEWVIRQYDHEVQGGSIIKPLQGVRNDGPGDGCMVRPLLDSYKGIAISNGINPRYGFIDPYWMAASAIDEALRNVTSIGGSLRKTALLDNFCWGSPGKPEQLAGIVRAAKACYDMAKVYGTPFISGKDSLNNEYVDGNGQSKSIPETLLISAVAIIPDVRKAITMDLKKARDLIYILGQTKDELGGSCYLALYEYIGNNVPKVEPHLAKKIMVSLNKAMSEGLVEACHDSAEGGIGVASSEMAFSGELGMEIDLGRIPSEVKQDDVILFSESNSRFIVEVQEKNKTKFEKIMKGNVFAKIGKVTEDKYFKVKGLNGKTIIKENIFDLKEAWQKTLRW